MKIENGKREGSGERERCWEGDIIDGRGKDEGVLFCFVLLVLFIGVIE